MEEFIKRVLNFEKIKFNKILKSKSGFTNLVFFIDDRYVIKVTDNKKNVEKLHKEIEIYKNVNMDEMPRCISSGRLEDKDYLIIEKISGESLFKVWHRLSLDERKEVVYKIANILKKFHSQFYSFLASKFIIKDWQKKWQDNFKQNINLLNHKGYETSFLENFAKEKLDDLLLEQNICLVYNDAHFDNFIYDKGKLKIIDFDRVVACSKDYELLIIKQMLDNPIKFASEEDEPNVKDKDYAFVYKQLKEFYPELFEFKYIDDRVYIYQFIYNLSQAFEYNDDNRIKNELEKFKLYFSN